MKILHISPFFPPSVGGMEIHVETLSRKQVEAGHDVTVYTSDVPEKVKYEECHGVHVHRFHSWLAPLNNQFTPGLLLKLLGKENFDVIHIHSHLFLTSNMGALARLFGRKPLVFTSHGAIPGYRGLKKTIEVIYNLTAGKWTLRAMDRVIALSPTQADILASLGARRKDIRIIPPGIELKNFMFDIETFKYKAQFGLDNHNTLLFVGTLIPRKGIECLIESLRYTKSKPVLLIAGGEIPGFFGHKKVLEDRVREAGVETQVRFLGHINHEILEPAYLASDVFVLPSLIEGLPLVLLEAMAYGRGIVATNIPGNCDAIRDGENGFLCKPGDAVDLARKIDILLENPDMKKNLGVQAHRDVLEKYGWDSVFLKVMDVYREVIHSGKAKNA